jgi:hypothetical protein
MVNDTQNDVIMKDINNKCYKQVRASTHIVTIQTCSLALIVFRPFQLCDNVAKNSLFILKLVWRSKKTQDSVSTPIRNFCS